MDNNANSNTTEDCLGCRLVSGFGCIGVGSYIMFQAKQMKGYNQKGMLVIGTGVGVLGLCRLLGINPFIRVT